MNAVDARLGLTAAPGVRPHYGDQDPGGPQKLDVAANAAKFAELKSSDKGLTSDEAKARLAKNGLDGVTGRPEQVWRGRAVILRMMVYRPTVSRCTKS